MYEENRIKKLIRSWIEKFKNLPRERKFPFIMVVAAGLVLIIGTLFIIFQSIWGVNSKSELATKKDLVENIKTTNDEIKNNLKEYGLDSLNTDLESINSNFDNYDDDLQNLSKTINAFNPPISSPIKPDDAN